MLSAALVYLFFCFPSVQAQPMHVHVALSEEGGAYLEFSDALRDRLQLQSVVLTVGDTNGASDADLIVAVGMRAATAIVASRKPVLNVLVPKAGYDNLVNTTAADQSSVIYLDQPIERQLSLLLAALPKVKRIGVLYTAPPLGLANLRRLVAERKLRLVEKIVEEKHIFYEALEELLDESEVLLVLPDTEIYNAGTIRNILLSSYRKQVPLIGIAQSYVNAGALCAIYSTPKQIAFQTAEAIKEFTKTGKLTPSQYPREFEVSVNMQVARSLGLPIRNSEALRNEVRSAP